MTWENAWQEGRTGWDAGQPAPTLADLVARGELSWARRALVPGCGAGYDAHCLAAAVDEVVGLDVAPTAAKRFDRLRDAAGLSAARVRIEIGDFFAFDPGAGFDLIWDYTFLCALEPSQRRAWAHKVDALLAPGGEVLTLIFPNRPDRQARSMPPYTLSPDDVRDVLEPRFEPVYLAPVADAMSHPGRAGLEWLGRWRRTA